VQAKGSGLHCIGLSIVLAAFGQPDAGLDLLYMCRNFPPGTAIPAKLGPRQVNTQ
jgi:hypothetical protein